LNYYFSMYNFLAGHGQRERERGERVSYASEREKEKRKIAKTSSV
jgi:hypothetical protein